MVIIWKFLLQFIYVVYVNSSPFIETNFTKYEETLIKNLRVDPEIVKCIHDNPKSHEYDKMINYESSMPFTKNGIRLMLRKALRGEDVVVTVIGESVSVGADLGANNKKLIYHHHFASWWNETIGKVTGSSMRLNIVAIGGVSSAFFGRCWREYELMIGAFDFVIWEFNINDSSQTDFDVSVNLERFIRSFYFKYDSMSVLFSVFYHRDLFTEKRHKSSENMTDMMAHKYKLACLNIEGLVTENTTKLHVFTKAHPSAMAHKQMAASIIQLFRQAMLSMLNTWSFQPNINLMLENPLYVADTHNAAVCWTSVYPDYRFPDEVQHPLFSLPAQKSSQIEKSTSGWKDAAEERFDLTGGYKFKRKGENLKVWFPITEGPIGEKWRELTISLRHKEKEDPIIQVALYSNNALYVYKNITLNNYYQDAGLFEIALANELPSGEGYLDLTLANGDYLLLSAIIIS